MVGLSIKGLVLGPYEALYAELMWVQEVARRIPRDERDSVLPGLAFNRMPAVPTPVRHRILDASLLYGLPDTSSLGSKGPGLLGSFMSARGIGFSYREWFEEVIPKYAPGSTPLLRRERLAETAAEWFASAVTMQDLIARDRQAEFRKTPLPVIKAVTRMLKLLGIKRIATFGDPLSDVATHVQTSLTDVPWPDHGVRYVGDKALLNPPSSYAATIANGLYMSIEQSIARSSPFLSSDSVGPEWVSHRGDEPQYEVVKAIFAIPDGPRRPTGFTPLMALEGDPRLASLRQYVDLVTAKVLTADVDTFAEVRREATAVMRSRRHIDSLDRVTNAVTFVAVPVGLVEAYAGLVGPGIAISALGALSEGMTRVIRHRNKDHWVSL